MSGPESQAGADGGEDLPPEASDRASRWKSLGRWVLLALGVGAVVYLVYDAGPEQVWATLVGAGVYLPLVFLGEIGFVGVDVLALRLIYGERGRSIPARVWLRSSLMAYGVMMLMPAGRVGGEVMRAANIAPYIGGARAAAGASYLQGVTLTGNALISIPCFIAVAWVSGPTSSLALLVGGNGLLTLLLGSALLFGARFTRLGGWLGARIAALASHGQSFDDSLREMPRSPAGPVGAALLGRLFQTLQYAVILAAVGGSLTFGSAFVAQAIHLVGAGLGDMIPNQVGVTEGAYRVFRAELGLGDAVASAIAIALIHRVCQFSLAGVSLAIGAVWKAPAVEPARETARSVGSPVHG